MAYLFDDEEETTTTQATSNLSPAQSNPGSIISLAPIVINASVGPDVTGDGVSDLDLTAPAAHFGAGSRHLFVANSSQYRVC